MATMGLSEARGLVLFRIIRGLAGCLSRAILRFNAEGLTAPQLAAVAKNPNLEAALVGSQVHTFFNQEALAAGLPDYIQVTGRFKFGPDVYDPTTGRWWDVTTSGQWANDDAVGRVLRLLRQFGVSTA